MSLKSIVNVTDLVRQFIELPHERGDFRVHLDEFDLLEFDHVACVISVARRRASDLIADVRTFGQRARVALFAAEGEHRQACGRAIFSGRAISSVVRAISSAGRAISSAGRAISSAGRAISSAGRSRGRARLE